MIRDSELTAVGCFNKPHGVGGEISATLFRDGVDLRSLRCIVVKVDGINVPFFLTSVRPKGRESVLVSIDGYGSDEAVAVFVNREFCAVASELKELAGAVEEDAYSDGDGFYASDLVGFTVFTPDGVTVGTVKALDDTTANVLFVVARPGGGEVLVPVADEFVTEVNPGARTLTMELPEGLLQL